MDPSFGTQGKVTADFGELYDYAYAATIQPDGRIVVAGRSGASEWYAAMAVARFNTDGTLDASFGDGGQVITIIGAEADEAHAVLVQPDGKVLVGGSTYSGTAENFALARYDADGSLDPLFGSGGIVTTPMSDSPDEVRGMALLPDGRILAVGYSWVGSIGAFAVARYLSDGTLDATFGAGGKVNTPLGTSYAGARDVVLLPDGRFVVAGSSVPGSDSNATLVRYNADGSVDNTFGVAGAVTTHMTSAQDVIWKIHLLPSGGLLVAGSSGTNMFVARYDAEGTLDGAFGTDGIVTTDLTSAIAECGLAVQADDKILVAANAHVGGDNDVALVRFTVDGVLDPTFGGDGLVTTAFGNAADYAHAVAIQSDHRIVIAGSGFVGMGHGTDFILARYLTDLHVGVIDAETGISASFIYPDPLDDKATFSYALSRDASVTLRVIDVNGRSVRTLLSDARRSSGEQREVLDLTGLAAGHYTLVLSGAEGAVCVRVVKR